MLRLLFALAVGMWLGQVACLSFVVAPAAHGNFDAGEARRFLRPIFPRYYRFGYVMGSVALSAVLLGRGSLPQPELLRLALPVAAAIVFSMIGGEILLPRLQKGKREDPSYERLHLVSTMLNTTTLAALVLAMAGAVMR